MDRIDFSGNTAIGTDGFRLAGIIVTKSETKQFDMSECDPNWQELQSFKKATKRAMVIK